MTFLEVALDSVLGDVLDGVFDGFLAAFFLSSLSLSLLLDEAYIVGMTVNVFFSLSGTYKHVSQ